MHSKYVIVCVDDEKMVLSAIRQQLRANFRNDVVVEVAESGEEALELIRELEEQNCEVPVLICDQIMPGMKGDKLIIETHKQHPRTLSVLLTGQADVTAVGNIINHGSLFRYISKPWEEVDLTLTIREAIRSYAQEKTVEQQNLALKELNESLEQKVRERTAEIEQQNIEIKNLNENLEALVRQRTREIEIQNQQIIDYAFFNAHQLRSPIVRLQGLLNIAKMHPEALSVDNLIQMLTTEAEDLNRISREITKILEEKVKLDKNSDKT